MRNGQNKRMRGRNRKGQNPLTRIYESNGPDVKIRGTASHVAEKYVQLARDAQASGDPVAAENYFQHAEHYFRLIATAQEQFRQTQPYFRADGEGRDDAYDDVDDDAIGQPMNGPGESGYGGREPHQPYPPQQREQPYPPREAQPYQPREQSFGPREPQPYGGRPQPVAPQPRPEQPGDVERLPAFITGGGQQPAASYPGNGTNGFDGQPDRFPLHRRRRRRHGPRGDIPGAPQGSGEASEEGSAPPSAPTGPSQE
ncbi:MAG: DUF4167 domain-containing protein [Xanthobacteraceae bacterium]|jgi:hypothetical protein